MYLVRQKTKKENLKIKRNFFNKKSGFNFNFYSNILYVVDVGLYIFALT